MDGRIAFQGEMGAYSHEACLQARPDLAPLPCPTFEDVVAATREGAAELAMLPVDNSTYGRVADIHRLLPASGLHIIDEVFVRVRIALLGLGGTALSDIERVRAHLVLLPQCREFLKAHGIAAEAAADSAGAAAALAQSRERSDGALASELAAKIYGLDVLARDIEDHGHNTTRFLVMSREPSHAAAGSGPIKTTFVFRVRNIPAALYKALGGFATNGVNMTKLESYMVDGSFQATQFYADIEGHPDDPPVARALEELAYFTTELRVLGVYPADPEHFEGGSRATPAPLIVSMIGDAGWAKLREAMALMDPAPEWRLTPVGGTPGAPSRDWAAPFERGGEIAHLDIAGDKSQRAHIAAAVRHLGLPASETDEGVRISGQGAI